MDTKITTINFGGVNCYLLQSDTNYILIDNGIPAKWAYLEKELQKTELNINANGVIEEQRLTSFVNNFSIL